ncbi:mucin-like protein [Mercenaria mercenaria]|uniref:mucin-like protein n=1 Tax=Mercenaria mercenaria TaxID=6596 RepID=UPI00234EE168|nr:mucin-like protein [Mercenaria mercenaria]
MDRTNEFRRIENGITRMAVLMISVLLLCEVEGRDNDAERQTECRKFTADKEIQNLIASGRRAAEPCPCIEQKIILDKTFEKTVHCYRQWFFQEGAKQMCCYSENGNLITKGSSAGYLLLESREEVIGRAHKDCCGNDSTTYKHSCQSFYEINSPDNCSTYHPPSAVTSSGDPRIEAIDGNNYYDFNGHGEYVFLTDNTNFEIQARTGYVVKGNNDSTMFTAFALSDKQNGEQIELHYDRGANDIRFYRNGKYNAICNASSPKGNGRLYPCEMPIRYSCQVLAGGGQIIVSKCGFGDYAKQITFGTDNFMSIHMSIKKVSTKNVTGLAGHQEDGFYVMRNKSRVAVNASASKLFDFAESWSLRNESESLFNYNDTGGNFTFYNKHHTRPKFLEDLLGNLTALFGNFTDENITLFNSTCRIYWNNEPNEQCLLTIARTGDYSLGVAVMAELNATHRQWEILNNIAPKFKSGEVKGITVIHDQIWEFNFTEHVKVGTQNDLNYTVHTEIPKEEYNLTSDGTFTWLVGTGLREKEASITFIAKDRFNSTASKQIMITYCGCETADECDFNVTQEANTNSSVGFTRANCDCPEYYTGDFCEIRNDPCANISCFDQSACNGNISKQEVGDSWPCAKCNAGTKSTGFIGGKQTCSDVNECLLDSNGCKQHCKNTNGSYFCECNSGYELESDGHSCKDIDECTRHTHFCGNKLNELCVNTAGSATCQCAPGYNRKMKNSSCTEVDIDECTRHTHSCGKNELCVNTKGNANCQCAPGYNRKMKNDSCTKIGNVIVFSCCR